MSAYNIFIAKLGRIVLYVSIASVRGNLMLKNFVLTPIIFFSGTLTSFASGSLSVPPASFIHTHVSTVGELARQVTIDPIVCTHLANHFHVTNTQMVQYVHHSLKLASLRQSGYYRVACVRQDGSEYWVNSYLKIGTPASRFSSLRVAIRWSPHCRRPQRYRHFKELSDSLSPLRCLPSHHHRKHKPPLCLLHS